MPYLESLAMFFSIEEYVARLFYNKIHAFSKDAY